MSGESTECGEKSRVGNGRVRTRAICSRFPHV